MTIDPLRALPDDCAVHTHERCPTCTAPIREHPLGGWPALWDAIGCDHERDRCRTMYELHSPRRCARLRAMLRHPAGRLIGAAAARPIVDTQPATGPWEDLPAFRPVSVRKIDGEWFLYDYGGGMEVRAGREGDLEPMPSRRCCCWDAAQGLASVLERHYLGLAPPSWANNGQHPPVRPGQSPCVDGITTS